MMMLQTFIVAEYILFVHDDFLHAVQEIAKIG